MADAAAVLLVVAACEALDGVVAAALADAAVVVAAPLAAADALGVEDVDAAADEEAVTLALLVAAFELTDAVTVAEPHA